MTAVAWMVRPLVLRPRVPGRPRVRTARQPRAKHAPSKGRVASGTRHTLQLEPGHKTSILRLTGARLLTEEIGVAGIETAALEQP